MTRRLAWTALALAFVAAVLGSLVQAAATLSLPLSLLDDDRFRTALVKALFALVLVLGSYGLYPPPARSSTTRRASAARTTSGTSFAW